MLLTLLGSIDAIQFDLKLLDLLISVCVKEHFLELIKYGHEGGVDLANLLVERHELFKGGDLELGLVDLNEKCQPTAEILTLRTWSYE